MKEYFDLEKYYKMGISLFFFTDFMLKNTGIVWEVYLILIKVSILSIYQCIMIYFFNDILI